MNNFNDWNIFNPCEEIMEPRRKVKEPMNNLPSNVMKCFFWEKEAVRTLIINGDPWFVGKDVAQILGYSNPSKALIDHVDDEDKLNNKSLSSLGQRGGWIINESGLYSLISSSQLPTAKRFKHWVTSEVLPTIRKTGGYFLGEEHMTEDELILTAMNVLQRKVEAYRIQVEKQAFQIECMAPKVESYDDFLNSDSSYGLRKSAAILHQKQNTFIKFLELKKFIYGVRNEKGKIIRREAYAPYIDTKENKNKWFCSTQVPDRSGNYRPKLCITPQGLNAFREMINEIGDLKAWIKEKEKEI